MPPFQRVVIAGLGLIGGSLALALRRAMPSIALAAWDDEPVVREGLRRGVIDAVCRPEELRSGDLLVLAAPPMGSLDLVDRLTPPPGCTITDVVSTKRVIVEAAASKQLPFVGGHPMAGSDRSGLEHALLFVAMHADDLHAGAVGRGVSSLAPILDRQP
jgi:prephenate dehydrogenase